MTDKDQATPESGQGLPKRWEDAGPHFESCDIREAMEVEINAWRALAASQQAAEPVRWLMPDGSCTADRKYGEGYGGTPLYRAAPPQQVEKDH